MSITEEQEDFFRELRLTPENKKCFECGGEPTAWASISIGVFLCIKCAGIHRSLGTHLSRVRSITLDSWKQRHLCVMKHGGNKAAKEFFQSEGMVLEANPTGFTSWDLTQRYSSLTSTKWKNLLKQKVEEELGPEEPKPSVNKYSEHVQQQKHVTAISSDGNWNPTEKPKQSCHCCSIM